MADAAPHVWHYVKDSLLGTNTEGPITEAELMRLIRSGALKPGTAVSSATRTKGKTYQLQQIPAFVKELEAGAAERERAKEVKREAAEVARAEQTAQRDAMRVEASRAAAAISDCSNIELVNTIAERMRGILTSSERLEYLVIQQRPVVNISPDAVAVTSRRLIFYHPKLLGRFEFFDYQWFDLHDAHIEQHMLTSTFTARHTNGTQLKIEYLPKDGAQKLYRMVQEREEQARVARHEMHLSTARAGAAQINIGGLPAVQPAATGFAVQPATAGGGSAIERLKTLKDMVDAGLITPAEFDERKKAILAQV